MLFPDTGKAVVSVLERLGHEVEFRRAQTCCGQMHYNTGYHHEALPLVKKFADVFAGVETICVPSASCVALIRDQYRKIAAGDQELGRKVEELLPRVFEFSELLVDKLGVEDVGAYFPHRVTYHPSCHSLRLLKVGDKPLRLLQKVRGIDLRAMPEADQCCGFGGTFAIKNAETSTAMLADKMRSILSTEAEVCTAGDNSCLMHIYGGLRRQQAGVRTMHLAEILASTEEHFR